MILYKILIQKDTVYEVMSCIGEHGQAHFIESNEKQENKIFKKYANKCEIIYRRIKQLNY